MSAGKLTEAEREALRGFVRGGSYSVTYGYDTQSRALHAAVEAILAEREATLRAQIAADIEAAPELFQTFGYEALYRKGLEVAARIARGGDGA